MRVEKPIYLIRKGSFGKSKEFSRILSEVNDAIKHVVWPPGAAKFTIYPGTKGNEKLKIKDTSNGVKPIKEAFVDCLTSQYKWESEKHLHIATRDKPGKLDVVKKVDAKAPLWFAVEWETGNISSSHRALNKMAVGLIDRKLAGGILILPTRNLYRYLTDRIGNVEELTPYFSMWKKLDIESGVLAVLPVEQDATSKSVKRIPKGYDGWALVKKSRGKK